MTQDGLLSQGKLRITRFCDTKTAFHYKYRATYPAAVYNQRKQPNPEVFLLAAEKLHQKPSDCLVVEDAEAGVKAALNGGFLVAGIGPAKDCPNVNYPLVSLSELPTIEAHQA